MNQVTFWPYLHIKLARSLVHHKLKVIIGISFKYTQNASPPGTSHSTTILCDYAQLPVPMLESGYSFRAQLGAPKL